MSCSPGLCFVVCESVRAPPVTARSRRRLVVLVVDRAVEVALVDQRLDGGPDLRIGDALRRDDVDAQSEMVQPMSVTSYLVKYVMTASCVQAAPLGAKPACGAKPAPP